MSWFTAKLTENNSGAQGVSPGPLSESELQNKVGQFVAVSPHAVYLIDGKKGSNKSVICRKNDNGGQTCLNLEIDGIKLFKQMQGIQYFCSLPVDVDATHFECRKIQ